MTFHILDPNLAHDNGHQMEWDFAIASAIQHEGEAVRIFANKKFSQSLELNDVTIAPHFTHTTYETHSKDRFTSAYDDFHFFNDTLQRELSDLPRESFAPSDTVLAPTLSENHLLGYVNWMKSFDAAAVPLFVVHLMFPSGLSIETGGDPRVIDPLRALFYALAFRRAAEPGPRICFFGGGRQIAREYSALAGFSIGAHAIPLSPDRPKAERRAERPKALLYAGDMKLEKGMALLPELVERLCSAHSGWDFVVHANPSIGGGKAMKSHKALRGLAERHANFQFHSGRLGREAYIELLASADLMISTYNPAAYETKSSGVLWECISLGVPILVPDRTWLANEAREWNVGYGTYSPYSVDAICEAFANMCVGIASFRERSRIGSAEFRALNGPKVLVDQIRNLRAGQTDAVAAQAANPPVNSPAIVVQEGDFTASAQEVKLADRFVGDRFRHLDISLLSALRGADSWPRIKFKFCLTPRGRNLEFRLGTGWPVVFQDWPSSEKDGFGPVLRLRDDNELGDATRRWTQDSDRRLLRLIAALLPEAVAQATTQSAAVGSPEAEVWRTEAEAMSRNLQAALKENR